VLRHSAFRCAATGRQNIPFASKHVHKFLYFFR